MWYATCKMVECLIHTHGFKHSILLAWIAQKQILCHLAAGGYVWFNSNDWHQNLSFSYVFSVFQGIFYFLYCLFSLLPLSLCYIILIITVGISQRKRVAKNNILLPPYGDLCTISCAFDHWLRLLLVQL